MSDEERCEIGEALVGVPGLPPLADLPHPEPPPSDEELWSYATSELATGPDLATPLRLLVALIVVADVLLFVIALAASLR